MIALLVDTRIQAHLLLDHLFKRAAIPPMTPTGVPLPAANGLSSHHPPMSVAQSHRTPYPFTNSPPNPFNPQAVQQQISPKAPTELGDTEQLPVHCLACSTFHVEGYCPLKHAGVEYCNLCGLPHYGHARTCPHLSSVTQLRAMLEAIKQSPEPREIKELAKKKITGILGDINQRRRRAKEAEDRKRAMQNGNHVNGNPMPGQSVEASG